MTTATLLVCGLGAALTAPAASAADAGTRGSAEARPGPMLALTAGRLNVFDQGHSPPGGGAEYRWGSLGRWQLIPGIGFTLAEAGAAYAYASLRRDFQLGSSWFLTPTFGAGGFRNGGDLDLGYVVEFKTGLELSFRVADRYRIGLLFYHLSNASLSDDNPGTEVLELMFGVPIGRQ
jgi:hypothetical protein